jgi:hypothetical protein
VKKMMELAKPSRGNDGAEEEASDDEGVTPGSSEMQVTFYVMRGNKVWHYAPLLSHTQRFQRMMLHKQRKSAHYTENCIEELQRDQAVALYEATRKAVTCSRRKELAEREVARFLDTWGRYRV